MPVADDRRQLGPGAVFTPTEAARMIPGNEAENMAWLRAEGLISHRGPRPLVVWGDVLRRLSAGGAPNESSNRPGALQRERL